MRRISSIVIGILSLGIFLASAPDASAVVRRRVGTAPAPSSKSSTAPKTSGGIGIFAKLRPDRRAIIMTITNIGAAQSVSYLFTYTSQGKGEGSQGTIQNAQGSGTARELLFGTCSSGTCTYHSGVTSATLEVRAKLKNGKTYIKRFRIKV